LPHSTFDIGGMPGAGLRLSGVRIISVCPNK
jgi:hypothetical protein